MSDKECGRRTTLKRGLLVVGAVLVAFQLSAADKPTSVSTVTGQIVEAKTYTSDYVAIAKQAFANKPNDLTEAQKKYATAHSKYDGWVAYVKSSIRDGNAKKLNKDKDYEKIASDATVAAKDFTDFVESKTGQSKAVTAILSQLADLGLKLWNGYRDRVQKDRAAAADAFEKDAKWPTWNDIKANEQGK